MSGPLILLVSLAYLLLLYAVAFVADRRARQQRSLINSPWVYALSMAVYCTAWTYYGSVGRAATSGVWFLPIYLGPMLAMVLAPMVLGRMIRIAKAYRITSIADFVASRYGKSQTLGGLVTLITVVGIVPYIALQLKAIDSAYQLMTTASGTAPAVGGAWWADSTLYVALALAGFTIIFGTRHLDSSERHEGMVAAIAVESLVKLVAFMAVGLYVTLSMFDGFGDLFARAMADVQLTKLLRFEQGGPYAYVQWSALTLLAGLSVILLPRQFQVMVVENVNPGHLRRAVWVFPLYLLLINIFVLPIALGGLLLAHPMAGDAETFVLSLPLVGGADGLALLAFVGGLSAATGMVIVEAIAVSTMVCNDLVMPMLLRLPRFGGRGSGDLTLLLLRIRRVAILLVLLLGYLYFHFAGEAYALVSIGLISFAAVSQFAPALLGGLYWRGATRLGAMAGLGGGFLIWAYTLMLPSVAKSGWMDADFLLSGPVGMAWLKPEALFGLVGMDNLTHSLFWSWLVNVGLFVGLSLWRGPSPREASQALLFVEPPSPEGGPNPVFWRGRARVDNLRDMLARFLGAERAQAVLRSYARESGAVDVSSIVPDAQLVHHVETHLAGAIGSASARVMMASAVEEESLSLDDVLQMVEEANRIRAHSHELEEKSRSLEIATAELRAANDQLKSLDRMKDDFMSSVTHELRTPLTSIRALAELMVDSPDMDVAQQQQFLSIIVTESERLSRLVNQVLDLAKIEAGHATWHTAVVDVVALVRQAVQTTQELFHERGARVHMELPEHQVTLQADPDRLTQVLLNLLSNASRYVPGSDGQVWVRLRLDRDGATIEVEDNGPGVALADRALVFEKFRQGSDRDHTGGTGLGLPISRQIIEHFGGRMWLRQDAGRGACFCFSLPFSAAQDVGVT